MLKPEHFKHTEIVFIWDEKINYETDSDSAIDLLEREVVESINYIGIYRRVKSFSAVWDEKSTPNGIVIDYYHFDTIDPHAPRPPDHHMNSFKQNWETTDDWKTRCQHSITVQYPKIALIKLLHDLGNTEVKRGMKDYVKTSDYFDFRRMETAEAIWFMSIVLGSNNE